MPQRHHYKHTFLNSLPEADLALLADCCNKWQWNAHQFATLMDRWFDNFDETQDFALALKLVKTLHFYSVDGFNDLLAARHKAVLRHLLDRGLDTNRIWFAVPDDLADSSVRHAHPLSKVWKLPNERFLSFSNLQQQQPLGPQDSLVLFNDTYGSGKQFMREVWPQVAPLLEQVGAVIIVGAVMAQEALDLFSAKAKHGTKSAHILPNYATNGVKNSHGFTANEVARLEELGRKVYPKHPLGFGNCGLLLAYHFQCPNNSLPLIWADGENNAVEGKAYPWTALFAYQVKTKATALGHVVSSSPVAAPAPIVLPASDQNFASQVAEVHPIASRPQGGREEGVRAGGAINSPTNGEKADDSPTNRLTAIHAHPHPSPLPHAGEGTSYQVDNFAPAVARSAVTPSKPSWASAYGEDQYGIWADVEIAKVRQRMRLIRAGQFMMGSPFFEKDRDENEGPQHSVTISRDFWMADTACTQALWLAVMGENPSHFKGFKGDLQRPVEQVSWLNVQEFLAGISTTQRKATLPTEAEWEYACRAGTATPFFFGQNITPSQVNYKGNHPYRGEEKGLYRETTVAVQALSANSWGLYQMHGNVWEWCADTFLKYSELAVRDPGLDMAENAAAFGAECFRVLRGGGWTCGALGVRAAYRFDIMPDWSDEVTGFRFVLRSL